MYESKSRFFVSFNSTSFFSSLIRFNSTFSDFSEYKSRIARLTSLIFFPFPFLFFFFFFSPINFRNFDNDVWGISYVNFRFAKSDTNEVSYNFCRNIRREEGGMRGKGMSKKSCHASLSIKQKVKDRWNRFPSRGRSSVVEANVYVNFYFETCVSRVETLKDETCKHQVKIVLNRRTIYSPSVRNSHCFFNIMFYTGSICFFSFLFLFK